MFLGIDESNHGRFPEIFVGTFSPYKKYVKEGCFDKQRDVANRNFLDIPYRHLIFSLTDSQIIGRVNIPIVAVCELAKYAHSLKSLHTIFLDGELSSKQRSAIEKIIFDIHKKTTLRVEPQLDTSLCLVNEADNRANALHRYYAKYGKKGSSKKDYLSTLITPRLEEYADYFI